MKHICVFGSSSEAIDPVFLAEAEKLGGLLAEQGCGVVYGAGRYGIMGAVARGVQAKKGELFGVCPDFFVGLNVIKEDYGEIAFTKTMRERKALMEERADAFIICAGGIGTMEEFFEVLTLKQLGRHSKPIVILNTLGYYDPVVAMMEQSVADHFMTPHVNRLFTVARTTEEAWEQLENYIPFVYSKYE